LSTTDSIRRLLRGLDKIEFKFHTDNPSYLCVFSMFVYIDDFVSISDKGQYREIVTAIPFDNTAMHNLFLQRSVAYINTQGCMVYKIKDGYEDFVKKLQGLSDNAEDAHD